MVAVNRGLLVVQHREQMAALEVEEALLLGQLMVREALQALLGKEIMVVVGFTLHLIMVVAEAEVLEPLVQVARVLLVVMVVMD
jgi:hypothetical protein